MKCELCDCNSYEEFVALVKEMRNAQKWFFENTYSDPKNERKQSIKQSKNSNRNNINYFKGDKNG